MYFNSFNFILAYPIIFMMYYLIPSRWLLERNIYLVLASYALYVCWNAAFCFILFGITVVSYFVALALDRTKQRRKNIALGGAFLILLPLVLIKYSGFLFETIEDLLSICRIRFEVKGLNWIIPIGLSFYTLQAISYICDVYKNKIESEKDFTAFALYLSFFPTITMGPITRAGDMLSQFKSQRPSFDYARVVEGLKMILWGMFMKVAVADRAGIYVDAVMGNYQFYTGASCLIGSVMYSIQIYTDFAGYSLIARGLGKTLCFDIIQNFRRPFFAHSVSDYWTRWHISLSTWLRDYIYIPLGGSREGKNKTYRNIFITFLVSGFWHGANLTFILWGMWHAICVMMERALNQQRCRYKVVGKAIKIIIAFFLINFSRILFHSPTVSDAFRIMGKIFSEFFVGDILFPQTITVVLALAVMINDGVKEFKPQLTSAMNSRNALLRWSTYTLLIFLIMTEGILDSAHFIYAAF